MREELFKILKRIIYIALAIIVITNVKSTEGFAYRDEGPKGLDVYSDENIQIIELEGVNIDSNPIRIQQNKGYNNSNEYYLYCIKPGDSFWSIAEKEMGNGSLYHTLAAYNDMLPNEVIHPNEYLKIPREVK